MLKNEAKNTYLESFYGVKEYVEKKLKNNIHTCTCTGHTYRLQYNPRQLTNNNILTMVIHFTNTSPWMITLPPTSSNRSHHTQQLSPFLEPLQLSTSRNIACPF